ncbi:TLC domain-containing protein 2-like [Asterias rubens]|uniref:TLC domain-containing protein 2-like n=1 Tax=Asterias rubens TaxID=7604 RepID=UPI0014556ACD|nr:TLC domain-containing protein 2-like [Asterias rubens]
MFPWFVPIAIGSAAGFQCFNSALDVLPISPPPGKYSGKDRHRWRNAATSFFNSLFMSPIVVYCLINHPRVWTDPIGYYSTFADAGFAILAGYMVYDTYDILVHTNINKVYGLITHHFIIGSSMCILSYEKLAMGVIYIGLLTEVHAIFLHSRQLLIMYGISKSSTLYSVHKSLNLVTFVTFRLAPLLFCCYGSYTMINKSFVILYYVLPCFTSAIFFINVVLLWRLVCSDVLVKGGKEQHILDG